MKQCTRCDRSVREEPKYRLDGGLCEWDNLDECRTEAKRIRLKGQHQGKNININKLLNLITFIWLLWT